MQYISLFDLLALNLKACFEPQNAQEPTVPLPALTREDIGKIVLCPLCLLPFTQEDLRTQRLSIEHIIPSGGRGANLTLTCKACNNKTGSTLDAQLRKRIVHEENFHREGGPVTISFHCGDGAQNAQLYIQQNENGEPLLKIVGLPLHSNPKLQEKVLEALCSPDPEDAKGRIDFTLGYIHVLSQTAMLRSAYLTMFRHFGYSYIIHPSVDQVRQQIWQPLTGTGKDAFVTHPHLLEGISQSDEAAQFDTTRVAWLKTPEQGFCVFLRLSQYLPYGYMVPMAKPCEDGDAFLRWSLSQPLDQKPSQPSEGKQMQFSLFDFRPDLLVDASSCHFVRQL